MAPITVLILLCYERGPVCGGRASQGWARRWHRASSAPWRAALICIWLNSAARGLSRLSRLSRVGSSVSWVGSCATHVRGL